MQLENGSSRLFSQVYDLSSHGELTRFTVGTKHDSLLFQAISPIRRLFVGNAQDKSATIALLEIPCQAGEYCCNLYSWPELLPAFLP